GRKIGGGRLSANNRRQDNSFDDKPSRRPAPAQPTSVAPASQSAASPRSMPPAVRETAAKKLHKEKMYKNKRKILRRKSKGEGKWKEILERKEEEEFKKGCGIHDYT
ncbi:hypothetical protein Pmani_032770, partial [Petrolisthes manimaculis]